MRLTLLITALFISSFAHARGLAEARGVQVVSFSEAASKCDADSSKSTVFSSGRFPAVQVNSRIESVTDVSKADAEIRLRLYGWVDEMTDFREADVIIRGLPDTLNKFRTDPNIGNRFVRITTDSRCAKTAALVDSVDVQLGWRQADPSLVSDTNHEYRSVKPE